MLSRSPERSYPDDKAGNRSCKRLVDDVEDKVLGNTIRDQIDVMLGHLYTVLPATDPSTDLTHCSLDRRKGVHGCKQAISFNCASRFDVGECTIDWIPHEL